MIGRGSVSGLVLASAAALVLSGCATPPPYHAYDGPQKAPAELALVLCTASKTNTFTVLGSKKRFVESALVTHVDGQPLPSTAAKAGALYVVPGTHALRCNSSVGEAVFSGALPSAIDRAMTARDRDEVTLDASAGCRYALQFLRTSRYGGESAVFWFVDDKGRVVAGESPYATNAAPAAAAPEAKPAPAGAASVAAAPAGPASVPFFLQALPADKAVVCVFRKGRMVSAAVSFGVRENNVELLKIGNGRYGHFMADPGRHVLSSNLGVNISALPCDLSAGRVYYFEASINGTLTAVEEAQALTTVRTLKPAK